MKQRGVTFIELIICIGILGMLGSLAGLRLGQSLHQQELDSASLQLVADLRWLQQRSINEGSGTVAYLFHFNQNEPCGYYITANTQVIKRHTFPSGIRLYVPYPTISFFVSGAPLLGAQTISLQSAKLNIWKYVILAPVTGRVRISNTIPQQGEEWQ